MIKLRVKEGKAGGSALGGLTTVLTPSGVFSDHSIMKNALIILLLLPGVAFSWGMDGHRVIATIAYAHLTPKVKAKVDAITLMDDEKYSALSRFLYASVWPDYIAHQGDGHTQPWHFVDYPIVASGAVQDGLHRHAHDVIWAIHENADRLKNKALSLHQRSNALRFLVHFVGDIHQPLHCATRITSLMPDGDKGANLFHLNTQIASNLHSYWDRGLGLLRYHGRRLRAKQVKQLAREIEVKYPPTTLARPLRVFEPEKWAQESYLLAKTFAYQVDETPSLDYIYKGQLIVKRQMAIAGYRLAALLNRLLSDQRVTKRGADYANNTRYRRRSHRRTYRASSRRVPALSGDAR